MQYIGTDKGRRRGFTLVELLVVIAVIALLVSILMPSLQQARQLASLMKCLSNERTISQAMLLYAADEDNRIPPKNGLDHMPGGVLDTAWCNDVLRGDDYNCWGDFLLWEKLLPREAFACPLDDWASSLQAEQYDRSKLSYGLLNNLYKKHPNHWGGQAIMDPSDAGSAHKPYGSGPKPPAFYGPSIAADIGRPSTSVMFFSSRGNPDGHHVPGPNADAGTWNWACQGIVVHPNNTGSYAFFDGHAERLSFQQVFGIEYDPSRDTGTRPGGVEEANIWAAMQQTDEGMDKYGTGMFYLLSPWD